jgi:hypothetical protein
MKYNYYFSLDVPKNLILNVYIHKLIISLWKVAKCLYSGLQQLSKSCNNDYLYIRDHGLINPINYELKDIYLLAPLAQSVEHWSYEPKVMGSNPIRSIIFIKLL